MATVPADIILITHEDENANFTDLVSGSPIIFRSSMAGGVNRASGVLIRGMQTSSENLVAADSTECRLHSGRWTASGSATLGAIEDAVTPSEALNIGRVDVLFIPEGGAKNFNEEKRRLTIDRLRPRIIVSTGGGNYRRRTSFMRKSVHPNRVTAARHHDCLRAVHAVKNSS